MKTEDCSNTKNENCQPEGNEKLMGRRELLNKAGLYALSATTMMLLLKSQPAKALSTTVPARNVAPETENWQRTQR